MYDDDFGAEMEAIDTQRMDADLEQATMEADANFFHHLEKNGICTHGSTVGYVGRVIYPEQEGLESGQSRCTNGCGRLFTSESEYWEVNDTLYAHGEKLVQACKRLGVCLHGPLRVVRETPAPAPHRFRCGCCRKVATREEFAAWRAENEELLKREGVL